MFFKLVSYLALALTTLSVVRSQFAFTVDNTNADQLYFDIQDVWASWADVGNQIMKSALVNYPDAWSQLTSIYGSSELPSDFKPDLARIAANALAGKHETTVWDPDAEQHDQYSFNMVELDTSTTSHDSSNIADNGSSESDNTSLEKSSPQPTASKAHQDSADNDIAASSTVSNTFDLTDLQSLTSSLLEKATMQSSLGSPAFTSPLFFKCLSIVEYVAIFISILTIMTN